MAFKMKSNSMAKLAKEAGNNRIINRMNKLQDKAEKANAQGKDKKAQRKIDKISNLEDKLVKKDKRKFDRLMKRGVVKGLKGLKGSKYQQLLGGSAVKLKEGEFTTSGMPENLYNADGKKINTTNIDEGNLSAVKVEKGTNRKYVVMQEKSDLGGAGSRFYLSKPKK